jgi:hypothetical protein
MRLLITAAILCVFAMPAQASHRNHRHRSAHNRHSAHRSHNRVATRQMRQRHHEQFAGRASGGMVTVSTAAGRITVARSLAGRFQALIADFVANGYRPKHIGCLAHGGHVPNSRHYAGAACDFDQRGWGKTVGFMYHAHAIIARHGLHDGCSFGDCGHVDDGAHMHYARRWRGGNYGG